MNLDSLVKQYQEVRKRDTSPGATAPRVWKGSVIRTYKTLLWTSEGGNIQALRSMLQVHKGSISIMVEAIQRYMMTCDFAAELANMRIAGHWRG